MEKYVVAMNKSIRDAKKVNVMEEKVVPMEEKVVAIIKSSQYGKKVVAMEKN